MQWDNIITDDSGYDAEKKQVLVISTSLVDILMNVDSMPEGGEISYGEQPPKYLPGGRGLYLCRALKNLDATPNMVARVGEDNNGRKLEQAYANEGINTRFISYDPRKPTGSEAIINVNGEKRTMVWLGANSELDYDSLEEAFTSYPDGAFLSMEMPDEVISSSIRLAAENGVSLVLDGSRKFNDFRFPEEYGIDVFCISDMECEMYTGIKPNSRDNALRACVALSKLTHAQNIAVKMDERGVFAYDGTYSRIIPSYRIKLVDSKRAKEVYLAALCLQRTMGVHIFEAVEYANAAYAVSALNVGSYYPTNGEIESFIEEHSV